MANVKMNEMSELRKQLDVNSADMLRKLVQELVQNLMAAEVDSVSLMLRCVSYTTRSDANAICARNPWEFANTF